MKKIVVMSDNHGLDEMLNVVKNLEPHADYYIHCGDSEASHKELLSGYICVKGNNDWYLDLPQEAILQVEDVPVLIVHGHRFGYFNRELAMKDALIRHECRLLLCGHTHMPMYIQDGPYTFINPGSTTLPRGGSQKCYAVVTVQGHEVVDCEFKVLK